MALWQPGWDWDLLENHRKTIGKPSENHRKTMDRREMVVLWDLMGVFTFWCHQTWLAGKSPIIMAVLFGKSLIHDPCYHVPARHV